MNTPWPFLILFLLVIACATALAEQSDYVEQDSSTPKAETLAKQNKSASEKVQPSTQIEKTTASQQLVSEQADSKQTNQTNSKQANSKQANSKQTTQSPYSYQPTEQISEDLSVAFPVDI